MNLRVYQQQYIIFVVLFSIEPSDMLKTYTFFRCFELYLESVDYLYLYMDTKYRLIWTKKRGLLWHPMSSKKM